MTPNQWRALALAYAALPVYDPLAVMSFRVMAADELRQFAALAPVIAISAWRGDGQPYASSAAMRADVLRRRRLSVFAGGNRHPCRDAGETFRGRAVHDVFGHALSGADFSPAGELRAFIAHSRMYQPRALPALASDNLGQTAYYYFHPVNEGKPHSARVWPEQKAAQLPEGLWRDLLAR